MFKLIHFLKNNFFLQNLAAWIFSKVPPFIEHNISKYAAIRKAFYLTALDQIEGDYLEFGVFTGSSFVFAGKFGPKMSAISKFPTRYFGFDSFEGFGEIAEVDKHPFYVNETFKTNFKKVSGNISKRLRKVEHKLIKGFFDQTCRGHKPSDYGIGKAKIVFIDCDLKEPAQDVFDFVAPIIQKGTVLVMDDFWSYRGDPNSGLAGAFDNFQMKYTNLKWRYLTDYGMMGSMYICFDNEKEKTVERPKQTHPDL